jgi:hypothetical protein
MFFCHTRKHASLFCSSIRGLPIECLTRVRSVFTPLYKIALKDQHFSLFWSNLSVSVKKIPITLLTNTNRECLSRESFFRVI